MKSIRPPIAKRSAKAPTDITGFDEITGGGLPHDRTSLLVGGPGSGKTLFALQFLMHGARDCKGPGKPIRKLRGDDSAKPAPKGKTP